MIINGEYVAIWKETVVASLYSTRETGGTTTNHSQRSSRLSDRHSKQEPTKHKYRTLPRY